MKKIVLIACASKKLSHAAPAGELYTSPLFRLSLAYARKLQPDDIYILSAKHGLLDLDDVIEPYDTTLTRMSSTDVKQWAHEVLEKLRSRADLKHDHFILLAGDRYRRYLAPHLTRHEVPMEGLPIGKQLQQLRRWLDE